MSCRALQTWVWRYGTESLPPSLAAHLTECPECRRLVEAVDLVDGAIRTEPVPDPGEAYWADFPARVAQRLDAAREIPTPVISLPEIRWRWAFRWAPAVAAAVLAVFVGRELIRQQTLPVVTDSDIPLLQAEPTPGTAPAPSSDNAQGRAAVAPDQRRTPARTSSPGPTNGGGRAAGTKPAGLAATQSTGAVPQPLEPTASPVAESPAGSGVTGATGDSDGWPQRQVTVLGQIAADTPQPPVPDESGLETQDAFTAYERQTARRDTEGAGALPVPGRLLEGPGQLTPGGSSDTQSPTEAMRRLDEIAELRQLIGRIQNVPPEDRTEADRMQYAALWYRLGIITSEAAVVDSALSALRAFSASLTDPPATQEWAIKQQRLQSRLSGLPR